MGGWSQLAPRLPRKRCVVPLLWRVPASTQSNGRGRTSTAQFTIGSEPPLKPASRRAASVMTSGIAAIGSLDLPWPTSVSHARGRRAPHEEWGRAVCGRLAAGAARASLNGAPAAVEAEDSPEERATLREDSGSADAGRELLRVEDRRNTRRRGPLYPHAPTQRAWSEDEVPHQHGRPSYMLSGGTLHRMAEYGRWGLGTRPGFDDVKLGSIGPRKDTLLRCVRADNGTRKLMAHANSAVQGVNTRNKSTANSFLG